MSTYDLFVLGQFLTEFPTGWDFDRVLETLEENDDDCRDNIVVWEPYEDWDRSQLCEAIDDMRAALERLFVVRQ